MPEGDTYATIARRLRPLLTSQTLVTVAGTAPSVRRHAATLTGATVTSVDTRGKHLLIDTDRRLSFHIRLGMNGRVTASRADAAAPGRSRLILATMTAKVAVTGTNQVEVAPPARLDEDLGHLGPDLLAAAVDLERIGQLAGCYRPEATISDLLVDQRVMAGIGNVYKSEVLFLEGIDPRRPVAAVAPELRLALAHRAHRLLAANVGSGARTTTGGRPGSTWVYDRAGKPCRRCRTEIVSGWVGDPPRITFWCPRCQT